MGIHANRGPAPRAGWNRLPDESDCYVLAPLGPRQRCPVEAVGGDSSGAAEISDNGWLELGP